MSFHLLWYDSSKRTLDEKIERAAVRYRERFGHEPNRATLPAGTEHPRQVGDIVIDTAPNCLAGHIQIYRNGDNGAKDKYLPE